MKKNKVIWRLTDGKQGHDKQSIALIKNIKDITRCKVFDVDVKSLSNPFLGLLFKKYTCVKGYEKPDIAIGTGHKTHFHLLAIKRCFGAKILVIMKPSLPLKLFDLCVIPKHDGIMESSNVIVTESSLINIESKKIKKENLGLFLIGGPSKHYYWDTKAVLEQIKKISQQYKLSKFFLTTSRRTPINFLKELNNQNLKKIKGYEYAEIQNDWLEKNIKKAKNIWVTCDSYSMLTEALSSGAIVDTIDLKIKKHTKLTEEIKKIRQNMRKKISLPNEAKRVANHIEKNKWF